MKMTVDIGPPMERQEHFVGDKRFLISSVKESLLEEKFTDCVLVTKEGIPVPVHRMVLTPSPILETLFLSTSCCRGLCSHPNTTTIMLPDVSYRQLNILLDFFYTGMIKCTSSEMDIIKDLLVNVFGVPRSTVMLHSKQGHTDCVECGEHLPINSLLGHLFSQHVEEPCVRDMARVEGGDSRAVTCSQHVGDKACDIDLEKTRISNGIFNYVGKDDPVSCVLDHYMIHFNNMVQFVRLEHPSFTIPSHVNLMFDEVKLRGLARNTSSHVLEPISTPDWNTRDEVDKFLQSKVPDSSSTPSRPGQPPPSPPPSATPPTTHSGGLSSPDEEPSPVKTAKLVPGWLPNKKDETKTKRKKSALSSSDSSDGDTGGTSDSFSDPAGSANITPGSSYSNKSGKYFPASKKPGQNSSVFRKSNLDVNIEPVKPLSISSSINASMLKSKSVAHSSVDSSSAASNKSNSSNNKRKFSDEERSNITSTSSSNIVSSNFSVGNNTSSNISVANNLPAAKKPRITTDRHRKCRVCRKQNVESQFARHVVTHLYQLWTEVEVGRREGAQLCREGCGKQLNSWKNHVLHLATHHDQLTKKLSDRDESLSDYEMEDEEDKLGAGLGEIGGLATLTASSAREVLARHDLSPDYLREEETSPRIGEELGSLNNSQNPLLDSSQEDAMVIVENGDEDVDVDELLDDSQDDPDTAPIVQPPPLVMSTLAPVISSPIVIDTSQSDSDAVQVQELINGLDSPKVKNDDSDSDTAPWEGEGDGDRMKEVEEE